MMNIDIEPMPALRLGTVRHVGAYSEISEAFARLHAVVARADPSRAEGAMIAVYYDDPETTVPARLRSDAAITLPAGRPLPEGLGELCLRAGRYAHATHVGPYSELARAWSELEHEWLPSSGEHVGPGQRYEIYRNTPETTEQEALRTDLYLPLT